MDHRCQSEGQAVRERPKGVLSRVLREGDNSMFRQDDTLHQLVDQHTIGQGRSVCCRTRALVQQQLADRHENVPCDDEKLCVSELNYFVNQALQLRRSAGFRTSRYGAPLHSPEHGRARSSVVAL